MATLTDKGTTVSLEFRFNEAGELVMIFTPGHFSAYEERHGIRIPTCGEVGWYASGKWQPVWRGEIENIEYNFQPLE